MKSTISILTTPTGDTAGTSLVLSFDDKRYLFGNVHEGLQRVCIESGTKLGKFSNIFLTGRTEWRTTGGLMGLILTVADVVSAAMESSVQTIHQAQQRWEERLKSARTQEERERMLNGQQPKDKLEEIKAPRLNIYGGENLMQLLATARRFIFRKGLPLDVHELAGTVPSLKPTWEDHNIQVWAMPVRNQDDIVNLDSQAPRKRLFDDYLEALPLAENDSSNASDSRKQQLKGVISDMFDSDWRLDALFDTPLDKVKLPANLFVRNSKTRQLETYSGPMPGTGQDTSGINVLVRRPWPGALVANLPDTQPSSISMSYIVKNQPRRGRFNAVLAKKFGLDPGPAYSKLANGGSVKNDKGETVTAEQVTGALVNGKGFAVIEIPSVGYLSSLKDTSALNNREIMQGIEAIFWIVGPGVGKEAEFQALVEEYPDQKHILSSPDYCSNYLTIDSAAAAQLKHRQIDKERFSIPIHNNVSKQAPSRLSNCVVAHRGLALNLEPDLAISTEMKPELLNTLQVMQGVNQKVTMLSQEAEKRILSKEFQDEYKSQNLPAENAEIITLGTGSAVPSKSRNVSATLIRVPNVGSYLLDAGENTMGQLSRIYPPEELQDVLRDLKLVWISHMHADHHLGLTSVIKAWHAAVYGNAGCTAKSSVTLLNQISNPAKYMVDEQRLCIVSEGEMLHWLREYSEIEDFGYEKILPLQVEAAQLNQHNRLIRSTRLEWHKQQVGFHIPDLSIRTAIRKATGLSDLQAVNVSHCNGARAVTMTWSNGLKISYSGDCRPSRKFSAIGHNSTVLIHEATFDDGLKEEAKAKKHSTTREAIGVGVKMGAKRIILTHFSQRYSKLPEMENVVLRPVAFEDADLKIDAEEGHPAEHIAVVDESLKEPGGSDYQEPNTSESIAATAVVSEPHFESRSVDESQALKELKIGVAFDCMRVKVKDIILLGKFTSAFQKLYSDDEAPDAERTARQAQAEDARMKREGEKKARQEKRRQEQIAESAELKRKASKSSLSRADAVMTTRSDAPPHILGEAPAPEHQASAKESA